MFILQLSAFKYLFVYCVWWTWTPEHIHIAVYLIYITSQSSNRTHNDNRSQWIMYSLNFHFLFYSFNVFHMLMAALAAPIINIIQKNIYMQKKARTYNPNNNK